MKNTHSLNKYSRGYLFPQSKKTLSARALFCLLCLFLVFFSVKFYSQQTIISGLENIHISEGATIITEDAQENITVITSQSVVTYSKREKSELDAKLQKVKIVKLDKKKTKDFEKKIVQKHKIPSNAILVYNKDSHSKNSFFSSNSIEKQGITNSNHYKNVFLQSKINWIVFLKYFQVREDVSYNFYHSIKVNACLFARPPPNFI